MKKIECQISEEKSKKIDEICEKEAFTRAEFTRRALESYLWLREHNYEIEDLNLKKAK